VLCSMLTVFLLMPALLILFEKPIGKTRHRPLIPSVKKYASFISARKPVLAVLFLLLIIPGILLSSRAEYACWGSTVSALTGEEEKSGEQRIAEVFGYSTPTAVLVPAGDPETERIFLNRVKEIPHITSAVGLAGIEISEGVGLYTPLTAQEIAGQFGMDPWKVSVLLGYYAWETGETITEQYSVPLIDLAEYLFRNMDDPGSVIGVFIDDSTRQSLLSMRQTLESGKAQLQGENYSRMVITADLPPEGEDCRETLDAVRKTADECFGEGSAVMTGNMVGASELRQFFGEDRVKISLFTVLFVFLILLFTFRSPLASLVLVFVIQGSIWFNFSATYLSGQHPLFLTYTIGSAIQMGATIDYAIVLLSHYQQNRGTMEKRPAMVKALTDSFVTVITSGIIMTAAGLLIAWRVSDVYVCHIGLAVGRGALISVILVLTVLPQLLVLLDKPVMKTTFRLRKKN
jgi:Predicted exporters of the RND superfamily